MARSRDVMNASVSRRDSRAKCGGVDECRDVMNYKPPAGPKNIMDPQGPGIHSAASRCGTQGPERGPMGSSGSVGLGGERVGSGNAGTQGKY